MKSLGLSPTEQEVVDMQCEVEKKGRIFFPDFCKLCLRKFREFDEENFKQELFKVEFSDLQFIWLDNLISNQRPTSVSKYVFHILDFLIILYFRISAGQSHILSGSGQRNIRFRRSHSAWRTSSR